MAAAASTSASQAVSSANKALVDAQKKLRISQQQVEYTASQQHACPLRLQLSKQAAHMIALALLLSAS